MRKPFLKPLLYSLNPKVEHSPVFNNYTCICSWYVRMWDSMHCNIGLRRSHPYMYPKGFRHWRLIAPVERKIILKVPKNEIVKTKSWRMYNKQSKLMGPSHRQSQREIQRPDFYRVRIYTTCDISKPSTAHESLSCSEKLEESYES